MGGGSAREIINATTGLGYITDTAKPTFDTMTGKTAVRQAEAASAASLGQQKAASDKLQQAQTTASAQAQAQLSQRQRARASMGNIFTSPLGLSGRATTARKTLLGQ